MREPKRAAAADTEEKTFRTLTYVYMAHVRRYGIAALMSCEVVLHAI